MSSEPSDPQVTALTTLSLLEIRLKRIEFLLTGSLDRDERLGSSPAVRDPDTSHDTIVGRLQQLQNSLDALRKLKGPTGELVKDIEDLRMLCNHLDSSICSQNPDALIPEIFDNSTPTSSTSLPDQATHIFANTSLYTETASRLSSLQSLSVPPAEQSAQLAELRPRIDAANLKQKQLEAQARELRERSARCLEWWVRVGVVGMGEIWSDWEARVREAERETTRTERMRTEKQGYV